MTNSFAENTASAIPIHAIEPDNWAAFAAEMEPRDRAIATMHGFTGQAGQKSLIPDVDGGLSMVLFGMGNGEARRRRRFAIASLGGGLPAGDYVLSGDFGDADEAALAWHLGQYAFTRYRGSDDDDGEAPRLVAPDNVDPDRITAIASSVALTRDLINTPANDMGPDALEAAFRDLGTGFGATVTVTTGDELISGNFPMIHAVGRASDQAPRLLELNWGRDGDPTVTLVGKGVCFDTGGLNLKPGSSMGLMKKDMGGGATTMGLARMIMARSLPVRLRLLVPAVENSVSAGAFRPGDILTARNGKTVEINNTDAEGRLVLADALSLADEDTPDVLICMATLTGAARVALGPDVPPFYSNDEALAAELATASVTAADPIWRLPLHAPYEPMIEPGIADLDNAPSGGFAGSITAALFLKRFVQKTEAFAHFDIYGWTPSAKPGRPAGGECQAARAVFAMLEARYGA